MACCHPTCSTWVHQREVIATFPAISSRLTWRPLYPNKIPMRPSPVHPARGRRPPVSSRTAAKTRLSRLEPRLVSTLPVSRPTRLTRTRAVSRHLPCAPPLQQVWQEEIGELDPTRLDSSSNNKCLKSISLLRHSRRRGSNSNIRAIRGVPAARQPPARSHHSSAATGLSGVKVRATCKILARPRVWMAE